MIKIPEIKVPEIKIPKFGLKTTTELERESKNSSALLFDSEILKLQNFNEASFGRVKALKELTGLPKQGEHLRIVTHNSFNAFAWVEYIFEQFNTFEEVILLSFNFSEKPLIYLFDAFDKGKTENLSIVISESIRFRMPKIYFKLKEAKEKRSSDNFRVAGVWNHAKIILMKPKGSVDYFCVEGSGNFTENAFIEQYSADNNKAIYDFHKDWIERYVFVKSEYKRHFIL